MKILVVCGHSAVETDVIEAELFAEGLRANLAAGEIEIAHVDQLVFVVAPHNFDVSLHGQSLCTFDLVILRGKMRTYNDVSYALSRFCSTQNVRFFNDYSGHFSGTKLAQAVVFYELGLPFLKTVRAADQNAMTHAVGEQLTMPAILKDSYGAKGTSNYLVKSHSELMSRLRAEKDVAFVAQEYCPNDGDFRLLILGEESVVIKRKAASGSHLNNTSLGATAQLVDNVIPDRIVQGARKMMQRLGLTIAGVDIIKHKETGEYYFLEINSQPQIYNGTFVDEKAELFTRLIEGER